MKKEPEKCLRCGRTDQPLKRGLCPADYEKYRRAAAQATDEEKVELDARLIEAGYLLPDARKTPSNPFKDMLNQIRAEADQQTIDSAIAAAAEAKATYPRKKAAKKQPPKENQK